VDKLYDFSRREKRKKDVLLRRPHLNSFGLASYVDIFLPSAYEKYCSNLNVMDGMLQQKTMYKNRNMSAFCTSQKARQRNCERNCKSPEKPVYWTRKPSVDLLQS